MEIVFSVIVPIYKVEKYIRKCIDSILSQTFENFELILVDDGSPDNCPDICDKYAAVDSRVKVIHKANGGLVSARNAGVRAAVGEYICYVDGDDWVAENLLEIVWNRAIKEHKPDMAVYSGVKQFEDKQEQILKTELDGLYDKQMLVSDVYPYMMYDCRKPFCNGLIFPVAWNKIYKRAFLLEHLCTEERIRMGEDNAFVYECMYAAETVYFCEENLYYYNQLNVGSMVHSYDPQRFQNNKLLTDYIERNMAGKDAVIDNQINAFKAYWLIMAVFHEVKCGRKFSVARKHVKAEIRDTRVTEGIRMQGLPKTAQGYLIMLKMHLYGTALLMAKILSALRG